MIMRSAVTAVFAGLLGLAVSGAQAAIVSTGGCATQIAPPASVAPGVLQSSSVCFAFNEQSVGGLDSHFVHFDPTGIIAVDVDGSVTFDGIIVDILGDGPPLVAASPELNNSDPIYGVPGTTYPTGNPLRGVAVPVDMVSGLGTNTLTFSLNAVGNGLDQIRVLTTPNVIPLPAALPLLGSALAFLGVMGSRRRRTV